MGARLKRQGEHGHVPVDGAVGEDEPPSHGQRDDKDIDGDEVEREKPGCRAHIPLVAILDDGDVELAWQQQDHEGREHGGAEPGRPIRRLRQHGLQRFIGGGLHREIPEAVEHHPGDEDANNQEGDQLHDGLRGDGQHEAIIVFRRIDPPRPESHGKEGQHQRNDDRDRQRRLAVGYRMAFLDGIQHGGDGGRDRLELQGDIGHRANHRDDRDKGCDQLRLAIAGGHEVGDGSDVLALGEPHDTQDQRIA